MVKMKKISKIFVCFAMSLLLAFTSVNTCLAADTDTTEDTTHVGGGGDYRSGTKSTKGSSGWTVANKLDFLANNFGALLVNAVGVFINPTRWTYQDMLSGFKNWHHEFIEATTSESFEDYIQKNFYFDDDGVEVSDKACDDLHLYISNFLEENTGWYNCYTVIPSDLVNYITDKPSYNRLVSVAKGLKANQIMVVVPYSYTSQGYYIRYEICTFDGIVYASDGDQQGGYLYYDWEYCCIDNNSKTYSHWIKPDGSEISDGTLLGYSSSDVEGNLYSGDITVNSSTKAYLVTSTRQQHRFYKTFEDYKQYSVGVRPYYATSQYYNYDSSNNNTVTISDDALQNGSVWGDVYNIVINNGGDGLTEDELRKILDEYFSRIGNGGGSSGGGSSGGGLSGLLSGLGSLGDALLAVIGKLLEYVGKAVELFTGTIEKVLDIIPKGFTELLTALFPFIPQEWTVAIELSLVLGVIVGIVGIFKK